MTLIQVFGALLVFVICPLIGGLPLVGWLTAAIAGQDLKRLGTGNISVSAAFYHGGKVAGILAVLSEALKGIAVVLLARQFFPVEPEWEIVALIALVMGRYWMGKGAGTTNVVWGYSIHDPISALFVLLIGGIGFTVLRDRQQGKFSILVLFPVVTLLRHGDRGALIGATLCLAALLAWIYTKMPDDLDLPDPQSQGSTRATFRFAQGRSPGRDPFRYQGLRTLDQSLDARKVGQKAATLAVLKQAGYPVPPGWVLAPGDDLALLIERVDPSPEQPVVVRSSAVGEDSETASAAGQYESILQVTSRGALETAIAQCFSSYDRPAAQRYRRDRSLPESPMAVLIQPQIPGEFSGVAFSRDPITRQGEAVVIEALPGAAHRIVSGKFTPESYTVQVADAQISAVEDLNLPEAIVLPVTGQGQTPSRLLQQVAWLSRHLEQYFHGLPQDVEWTFDGEQLWLLQSRPITTLRPIWTRKIAAEVIPGLIRPLTWSINRPLTCGVWGQLFTIVLGDRARGLDFTQTATLHYSQAYFNATLLGDLFRRMGLPAESLEFLTRGAKFRKPPLLSTLGNLPGLARLAHREWRLEQDWQQDWQRHFQPILVEIEQHPTSNLPIAGLLDRIEHLLQVLQIATYYSILAPLSAALRQAIGRVEAEALDNSATPEVAVGRSLQTLANRARRLVDPMVWIKADEGWEALAQTLEGQQILADFEQVVQRFGHLSEVGTDIAVPTWREDPQPLRNLFSQLCQQSEDRAIATPVRGNRSFVQRRVTLKGQVTDLYSRLLAELRWNFVALEQQGIAAGWLQQSGDIFFLEFSEIMEGLRSRPGQSTQPPFAGQDLGPRIADRKVQLERDRQLQPIPYLVYGDDPPPPPPPSAWTPTGQVQGMGASAGQVEGRIQVVRTLSEAEAIDRDTILVVPYTDSGWAAILAQAGGLISEVGGRLSHGAIVAREYRIPAVMDIPNATQQFRNGQRVRINGQTGRIDILEP